ncbi:sensor histidine kinase [Streptomyces sp. UNOC14_S4]|uniref:sensor histidine kinase n=1 Tax=Streptomyces sp. UNOC14_S4 TaxID=2872340 RepID=UPI001E42E0E8|nr:histidine kinase [Streptomyces sp. UNOC14_S4]MCC3772463.1 two-component sensor histidine kinase [Streptomyces sp. UNOC14_S4]
MTPITLPSPPAQLPPSRSRRRHGWLVAGLCGLWAMEGRLLSRGAVYPGQAGGHHAHLVVWVAGLLVAACVLPWAQLVPRAVAAVLVSWSATGYLLSAGEHLPVWGLTESAALLVLLAFVAWRTPVRAAVPLGVALAAGVLAAPVRDSDAIGATVVAYSLVVAGVVALGLCLRYRDVERARAVAAAREAERLELAGELHDFVAHQVAAMTLMAKATGSLAKDARVAASLKDIQDAGDEAMTSARRLLRVLQQDQATREPLPGLDRIAELVDDFSRRGPDGRRVTLYVDPCFDAGLAPELAASVRRIVAEALSNVTRHSPGASVVEVSLRGAGARLFVSVRDDGRTSPQAVPRSPEDSGGLGLVGLTERADAIGGSLTAGPVPGGGWEVLAVLPVQHATRATVT